MQNCTDMKQDYETQLYAMKQVLFLRQLCSTDRNKCITIIAMGG